MNENTFITLEFDKIKELVKEFAVSGLGRTLIDELVPATDRRIVMESIRETTEARAILDASGHVPLHGLSDVSSHLERISKGAILEPQALTDLGDLLRGCRKIVQFMDRFSDLAPVVARYAGAIVPYADLEEQIETCIENGRVSNAASNRLAKIRVQIETVKGRIKDKMNSYINSEKYRSCLQETFVSLKDDRYCIAVKTSHRHLIDGAVVTSSGSGSTLFVEPAAVRALTDQLKVLYAQEEAEEYQILSMLTGELAVRLQSIRLNVEIMAAYDFAFAKAKYARSISAVEPVILDYRGIQIHAGRHPLLGKDVIPLDFYIGRDYRTLLITGPNTGGKTVALKTIGLFALMAQSGLHLPAGPGTALGVFRQILVDIGDQQSIEQSLSTFSGHLKNVISILNQRGPGTLALFDEIGTGTDPAEGAALGAAILDDLCIAGGITVATTHYGDLKRFAETRSGFRNGCMAFDPETLKPLYSLFIGQAGQSNGFWIAKRLGMGQDTLDKAIKLVAVPSQPVDCAPECLEGSLGTFVGIEMVESKAKAADLPKPGDSPKPADPPAKPARPLRVGDSVYIGSLKEHGILCETVDSRGEVVVLVKDKRIKVNHKRISLHIPYEELYPENYDLDIVLLSKDDRRLQKAMSKRHVEGKARIIKGGENLPR
ncbi:MAG TPA: mannonate oxidoreductase [Firmicutes bacterium]|nr:mannonate oxidoreductase [Bacillota bacterium]